MRKQQRGTLSMDLAGGVRVRKCPVHGSSSLCPCARSPCISCMRVKPSSATLCYALLGSRDTFCKAHRHLLSEKVPAAESVAPCTSNNCGSVSPPRCSHTAPIPLPFVVRAFCLFLLRAPIRRCSILTLPSYFIPAALVAPRLLIRRNMHIQRIRWRETATL